MSYIFGTNVDINYNETLKQRIENLLTFPTLTSVEKGAVFFHTANNKFYGWTGTAWLDFSLGGGGGSGVDSFNTRTGVVVPAAGDYDAFYYTETEVDTLFMSLALTQTVTGAKTFTGQSTFDGTVFLSQGTGSIGLSNEGSGSGVIFTTSLGGVGDATFDFADLTVNRRFTFPDAEGTISLVGDPPAAHTHLLAAGATDVTATATELNLLDLSSLTVGWVLSADSTTTASWKAPGAVWGGITGTLSDQTDLQTALDDKGSLSAFSNTWNNVWNYFTLNVSFEDNSIFNVGGMSQTSTPNTGDIGVVTSPYRQFVANRHYIANTGAGNQDWLITTDDAATEHMLFQIEDTAGTGTPFTTVYTLNKTGTPTIATDLVDKAYADSLGGGATISDVAYPTGWDTDTTQGASRNALFDIINTLPTLAADNIFAGENRFNDVIRMGIGSTAATGGANSGIFRYLTANVYAFHKDNSLTSGSFQFSSLTANRTYTWPDETGTVALSENTVNLTGNQTNIAGLKVFTSATRYQSPLTFDSSTISGYASGGAIGYLGTSRYFFTKNTEGRGAIFDFGLISAGATDRTYTFPNKNITVAESQSGTWTPVVVANGTAGYTYSVQTGTWWRVGDIVHIEGTISVSSTSGTPDGTEFHISGLPFAPESGQIVPISMYTSSGFTVTGGTAFQAIIPSDDVIWVTYNTSGGGTPNSLLNNEIDSSFSIHVAGTYITAVA